MIGGYTPSDRNFDALIFGYYNDGKLQYVARTRNGFTPSSREQLFKKLKPLEIKRMPLREPSRGEKRQVGSRLTAVKMNDCRWLKPILVGQFEFTEWTPDNHLRHSRFVALRDDKKPKEVSAGRMKAIWSTSAQTAAALRIAPA